MGGGQNNNTHQGEGSFPRFSSSAGAGSLSGSFATTTGSILSPGSSVVRKASVAIAGLARNAGFLDIVVTCAVWMDSSGLDPITRIRWQTDNDPTTQFVAGSSLKLYGLKTMTVLS